MVDEGWSQFAQEEIYSEFHAAKFEFISFIDFRNGARNQFQERMNQTVAALELKTIQFVAQFNQSAVGAESN